MAEANKWLREHMRVEPYEWDLSPALPDYRLLLAVYSRRILTLPLPGPAKGDIHHRIKYTVEVLAQDSPAEVRSLLDNRPSYHPRQHLQYNMLWRAYGDPRVLTEMSDEHHLTIGACRALSAVQLTGDIFNTAWSSPGAAHARNREKALLWWESIREQSLREAATWRDTRELPMSVRLPVRRAAGLYQRG